MGNFVSDFVICILFCLYFVYWIKTMIERNKVDLKEEMCELGLDEQLQNSLVLDRWKEEIEKCGKRRQFAEDLLSNRQKDLMQYFQLTIEIEEGNCLKPFAEKSRDGIGISLVAGSSECHKLALQRQESLKRKEDELKILELRLGIVDSPNMKNQLIEEGKQLMASEKRKNIRDEIEMLNFSISQRVKNMGRLADSSKQRSRLRSKNASEKKKLEDLVKQHTFIDRLLNEPSGDITTTQALEGSFPWIDELDDNVVLPLRAKRKVIEIYLIGKRLEEEIPLLEDEMVRCLKYYRDKVMPSLTSGLNSLDKDDIFDDDLQCSSNELDEGKYQLTHLDRIALAGKKSVLTSGIFFCKRMIKESIDVFKDVVNAQLI